MVSDHQVHLGTCLVNRNTLKRPLLSKEAIGLNFEVPACVFNFSNVKGGDEHGVVQTAFSFC